MANRKPVTSCLLVLTALLCSSTANAQLMVVQNCTDLSNRVVELTPSVGYNASINTVVATFTDPSIVPLTYSISSTYLLIVGNNLTVASSLQPAVGKTLALVFKCPNNMIFPMTVIVMGNSAPQWNLPSGNSATILQYTLPNTSVISAVAADSVTQGASKNIICSCQLNSTFFAATVSGNMSSTCTVALTVAQIFAYQQVSSPVTAVLIAVNVQYSAYPLNSATTTLTITIGNTDTVNVQWLNAPYSVTLPYGFYNTISIPSVLNAVNGNPGIASPPSTNFAVMSSTGNIPSNDFVVIPDSSTSASITINYHLLPGSTIFLILSASESGTQSRSNVTYLQISVQLQATTTGPSTTTTPCMISVPLVLTNAPNAPMFTQAQFQFSVVENVPQGFTLADLSKQIVAKGSAWACYSSLQQYFYIWQQINGTADWQTSPTSGLLQTVNWLNCSNAQSYTYKLSLVSPYDNKTTFSAATVNINVIECNSNPQFVKSAANVIINTTTIQHVPALVATLKATSVAGSLQYAILDNTDIFSASTQGALYLLSNNFSSSVMRYVSVQACDNSSVPRCSYLVYNVSLVVPASSAINLAALSWGLFAAVGGVMIILLIVVIVVWKQRQKPISMTKSDVPRPRTMQIIAPYIESGNRPNSNMMEPGTMQAMQSQRNGQVNGSGPYPQNPFSTPAPWDRDSQMNPNYFNPAILDRVDSIVPRKGKNRPALGVFHNQQARDSYELAGHVYSQPGTLQRSGYQGSFVNGVRPVHAPESEALYSKVTSFKARKAGSTLSVSNLDDDTTLEELYARIRTGNLPTERPVPVPIPMIRQPTDLRSSANTLNVNFNANRNSNPIDGKLVAQARFSDDGSRLSTSQRLSKSNGNLSYINTRNVNY